VFNWKFIVILTDGQLKGIKQNVAQIYCVLVVWIVRSKWCSCSLITISFLNIYCSIFSFRVYTYIMYLFIYGQLTTISQELIQKTITGKYLHIHFGTSTVWVLPFITHTLSLCSKEGLGWTSDKSSCVITCPHFGQNRSRAQRPQGFNFSSRDLITSTKKARVNLRSRMLDLEVLKLSTV
jgi:hypothetical protein